MGNEHLPIRHPDFISENGPTVNQHLAELVTALKKNFGANHFSFKIEDNRLYISIETNEFEYNDTTHNPELTRRSDELCNRIKEINPGISVEGIAYSIRNYDAPRGRRGTKVLFSLKDSSQKQLSPTPTLLEDNE
jgi:hypothetical protein